MGKGEERPSHDLCNEARQNHKIGSGEGMASRNPTQPNPIPALFVLVWVAGCQRLFVQVLITLQGTQTSAPQLRRRGLYVPLAVRRSSRLRAQLWLS